MGLSENPILERGASFQTDEIKEMEKRKHEYQGVEVFGTNGKGLPLAKSIRNIFPSTPALLKRFTTARIDQNQTLPENI